MIKNNRSDVFRGTINGCETGCVRHDARDHAASTVSASRCSASRTFTSKSLSVVLEAFESDATWESGRCGYSSGDDCYTKKSSTITMQDTNGVWTSGELCSGHHCVQYQYKMRTITVSPTSAPTTAPVLGMWTVTRGHDSWDKHTTDTVCGLDNDVFSIGHVASNHCTRVHGTTAQVLVNQDGLRRSEGWFCSNQGSTSVQAHPTFDATRGGECEDFHHTADDGQ